MSLQDQIDEAWKSYCGDAELNPNIHPEKQEGFEDGYRAAMKRLYREVKPEDCKPDTTYLFVANGEVQERRVVLVELLELLARGSEKIYRLDLPNFAEIFKGEKSE